MIYFMFTGRGRSAPAYFVITCMMLMLLAFGYAACANLDSSQGARNVVSPGDRAPGETTSAKGSPLQYTMVMPGVLTVASDTTNPPQEFIDDNTSQPTGFDIDLITTIAHRLGLKVQILTTKIDILMSDLRSKRYDVAISAIPITPDSQAMFKLIPYFKAGSSLLVRSGNPANIRGMSDLCGRVVGVQSDTREQLDLQHASEICQQKGRLPISLTILKNQFDVVQLLKEQRVVATYQASATSDYFVKLNPGYFTVGGPVLEASLEGIAINKDNTVLYQAIQATLERMKADMTYQHLIQKWGLVNEEVV